MRLVPLLALSLTGCLPGPPPPQGGYLKAAERRADPSAVISAELAFAKLAQDKGQWTAFAQTSTGEAIMFVPQPTNAHQWLKGRANPAVAVKWQPHQVWSSCDGSLAVTRGAWQRPNGVGYFTTVWQRQRDGTYKWVLDQGDGLETPLPAPEMIAAKVADCRPAQPPVIPPGPPGMDRRVGWSDDHSLQWIAEVMSDGSRTFKVHTWSGTGYEEVLRSAVAAGG